VDTLVLHVAQAVDIRIECEKIFRIFAKAASIPTRLDERHQFAATRESATRRLDCNCVRLVCQRRRPSLQSSEFRI